jgi:hypothetical protein
MTMAGFAVKKKLHNVLFDLIWEYLEEKRKAKPDYNGQVREKPAVNVSKVAHYLVKGWRMSVEHLKATGMPESLCHLVTLCWDPDPATRPTFDEILPFLEVEVRQELLGATGSTRKGSTANELKMRMARRQEELKQAAEDPSEEIATLRKKVGELEDALQTARGGGGGGGGGGE